VKNTVVVFALMGILIVSGLGVQAIATPNENANERAKSGPVVSIPENAVLIGENTYYLGKSKDIDGTTLEGFVFVYRANDHFAKPPGTPGNGPGNGDSGGIQCFEYIGGKWNPETEGWVFDTKNNQGMTEQDLFNDFAIDIQNWEDATDNVNILQGGTQTSDASFTVSNDGVNNVFFGDIDSSGAIAATWVWTTVGKPSLREIRAFDMVFDQVDFDWTNKNIPDAGTMDFNNIAEHEIGHAVGMAHPGDGSCSEETMWSTAGYAEIKKRDLHDGDIDGIFKLYS